MPKYRAIIERTVMSREIIEFTAENIIAAARRAEAVTCDRGKAAMRGVVIARPFADDTNATTQDDVVQLIERP